MMDIEKCKRKKKIKKERKEEEKEKIIYNNYLPFSAAAAEGEHIHTLTNKSKIE